ncbi:MAG: reverse transcriptase N-terminal domain-containing protein [Wolbachia endosymbiont of Fragariocoptes setiger]|nr:reverse transcriptase N-terminal domain-containing protein [Wolbachia endosymbiont of Fragariocoptes setiger]
MNSNEYVIDQQSARYKWSTIPWRKLEKFVFKLQKRIYQAASCNDIKKVHKLQRLLLNSMSAKLLAVRKVTQDNRGKKTAGIDGKANLTQKERLQLAYSLDVREKAKPSRRIWIPKSGKTEKRSLGIPTISERAKETLMKMAIEPEWEAKLEPNTYGFRPGRSCHDAITAIFLALGGKKTVFVLDADISGCFDNIDQKVLLEKLNTTPTFKKIIKGWLRAGVIENRKFKSTKHGTIQGGAISPLLACIALHGLESHIKGALACELLQYAKRKYGGKASRMVAQRSISVIVYADDFVVLHESEEIILKAKIIVEEWLKTIGPELKASKTKVAHTLNGEKPGFNFLGFFIRHYPIRNSQKGYKLLIKPSQESIKQHKLTIKHKLKGLRGGTQEAVIKELNPIVRGWSQYYMLVVSRKIFELMSNIVHMNLWKWSVFRHPHKGKCWIKRKYFNKYKNDNSRFMTNNKIYLIRHSDHAIKRHIKVKGTKSPYDGDWVYWGNLLRKIPDKSPRVVKLLKLQHGKCSHCQLWFKNDDILEIHHIDRNRRNNMNKNLSLLHGHCHNELHRRCA